MALAKRFPLGINFCFVFLLPLLIVQMSASASPNRPFYVRLKQANLNTLDGVKLALEIRQAVKKMGSPLAEGGHVTFLLDRPGINQAAIAGDWTDWRPAEMKPLGTTGLWWTTLDISEDARLEYKFFVASDFLLDPANPRITPNGLGGTNSVVTLRKYQAETRTERVQSAQQGTVETFSLESGKPGSEREITVYLPAAYTREPTRRFPTLYLNDGGDYLERVKAAAITEHLIAERRIEPLILVLVPPKNRMAEYWRKTNEYAAFLVEELVPEIDRRYRTLDNPERRGIGGASLGGLVSLRVAMAHPEIFGEVLSQSGSFWADERDVEKAIAGKPATEIRLWLDYGTFESELTEANKSLARTLKKRGWTYHEMIRPTAHNWTAWRDRFAAALQWLYPMPEAPRRAGFPPDAG